VRRSVIPVVDLRSRLGPGGAEASGFTLFILVTMGPRVIGVIVDTVPDAQTLADDLESSPGLHRPACEGYLSELSRTDDEIVVLLDIDRALAGQDKPLPFSLN